MPAAKYRPREVFDALMWDGNNQIEVAEFMGKSMLSIQVREPTPPFNEPRHLVILVGWGTMNVGVGDYITRKGKEGGPYSVDVSDGERFLMFNEKIDA